MREILTEHGKAAKTYLSAYRRTERGIAVRLRELERLRTLSEQVRSAVKPGMRADSLGRIQALEAEAADGVSRLCALRQEIEQQLERRPVEQLWTTRSARFWIGITCRCRRSIRSPWSCTTRPGM